MLKIENGILSVTDNEIKSSDTILELQSDVDCQIFGKLIFRNAEIKIVQFEKIDDKYKGRLVISQEDLSKLSGAQFFIVLVSANFNEQTNGIQFKFNQELIKKDIRLSKSEELSNIYAEVNKLKSIVTSLEKGGALKFANVLDKDLIQPGMIPVAIDNKGNFVAAYPFVNLINEVNGQKAVNGVVILNAAMIKCNSGKTIQQTTEEHVKAIQAIADGFSAVSDQQKEILRRLDDIDIRLSQHINDGII